MFTISSFASKLVACTTIALVITAYPIGIFSSEKENKQAEKVLSTTENKVSTVILGSSSKGNLFALSNLEKINQLLEGKKNRLTFEEVEVKFGNIVLTKNDILTSPCSNNTYYLLQASGRGQYKLENGKISGPLRCHRGNTPAPYQNLNSVNLTWTKTKRSSIPAPTIHLNKCFFTKDKSSNITIICNEHEGPEGKLVGTFGQESFKYDQ